MVLSVALMRLLAGCVRIIIIDVFLPMLNYSLVVPVLLTCSWPFVFHQDDAVPDGLLQSMPSDFGCNLEFEIHVWPHFQESCSSRRQLKGYSKVCNQDLHPPQQQGTTPDPPSHQKLDGIHT